MGPLCRGTPRKIWFCLSRVKEKTLAWVFTLVRERGQGIKRGLTFSCTKGRNTEARKQVNLPTYGAEGENKGLEAASKQQKYEVRFFATGLEE